MLPKTTYVITDGNLSRLASDKSSNSGFICYNNTALPASFGTLKIKKFTSEKALKAAGIDSTGDFKTEFYQARQFFNAGGVELYLGIFPVPATTYDFAEVDTMMDKTLGGSSDIRQIGLFVPATFSATHVTALQNIAEGYLEVNQPILFLYGANTGTLEYSELLNARVGNDRVTIVVGQDLENYPLDVKATTSMPNVGIALGQLSSNSVSTNILSDGDRTYNYSNGSDMVKVGLCLNNGVTDYQFIEINQIDQEELTDNGYMFWRYLSNATGTFLNNDVNGSLETSDYNSIALVRTMNEVIRLVDEQVGVLIGRKVTVINGEMAAGTKQVYLSAISRGLALLFNKGDISNSVAQVAYDVATKTVLIELAITPTFSGDSITVSLGYSVQ